MCAVIIDDEEDICFLLAGFLRKQSMPTTYSHSLKEGILILSKLKPELIFLDNTLPDGSGIDCIPLIRSILPKSKIIVISALSNLRERAISNGANNFIDKPISFESILSIL
jgi:DNA-binding NtrC family response regulator